MNRSSDEIKVVSLTVSYLGALRIDKTLSMESL